MRVLVADADEAFRDALATHLRGRGHTVELAREPSSVQALVHTLDPQVTVVSVHLDERPLLPDIRGVFGGPLAVAVDVPDPGAIRDAIRSGARGCILRSDPLDQWTAGLATIVDGGVHASPALSSTLLGLLVGPRTGTGATPLTAREIEVLDQAARGHSNREIAEVLGIAENTVKNHLRNILEKLHLHSRLEAVLHAVREGLISLD